MRAILGTAGHIDHGKTALVHALTGQNTDRLPEEKERGISIDLGFAYLDLPSGERAGIVDVPGHERFIRNMLAGAHGVDVVLLVVAADDGVKPQTEEHLQIVDLLGIERAIAVISKSDLVDEARIAAVKDQVAALLRDTRLAGAPAIAVSSRSGSGLDALVAEIEAQLAAIERRATRGAFRLPIDRAFVLHGHGVVVTGTAISGKVRTGDTLRLLPGGEEGRVRSLQVHGEEVAEAAAGQRIAVNLGGVERTDVRRGHLLADPRFRAGSERLDAVIALGPARALRNHSTLRLHLGTAAVRARLHLLEDRSELAAGEGGYAQLALEEEVAAVHGDRFVLRDGTGQRTLGGGVVLHPRARRHRRGDGAVAALARLEAARGPAQLAALVACSGSLSLSLNELLEIVDAPIDAVLADLRGAADLVLLPSSEQVEEVATSASIDRLEAALLEELAAAHREQPLAAGVEMESIRSKVAADFSPKIFRAVVDRLAARAALVREESALRLPQHRVALAPGERALASRVEDVLASAGLAPPDLRTLASELEATRARLVAVLTQLEREERVAKVAPELWFSRAAVEEARALLVQHLRQQGSITAAQLRDLTRGSRKFSIALLDYFDRTGFTLRVGDLRKLRR